MKKSIVIHVHGQTFFLFKSTRKYKKYDVYTLQHISDPRYPRYPRYPHQQLKYVTSFGDSRYEHYYDKIGLYAHLDHNDLERRRNYRSRHTEDHTDPTRAGYWSWNWLW